jgi:hypothetical protein
MEKIHTNPSLDAVVLRQFSSVVLLSDSGGEILERPLVLFDHGDGVVLHAFGVL